MRRSVSIESAVLTHIDLASPPTDAQVFDGIPTALPEEIVEKIARRGGDENWEDPESDAATVVPAGD